MEAALIERVANTKMLTNLEKGVLDIALMAMPSPLSNTLNFTRFHKSQSPEGNFDPLIQGDL